MSHRKGAVDGLGDTVKRAVWRYINLLAMLLKMPKNIVQWH